MAIAIKSIPVLKNAAAVAFNEKVVVSNAKKSSVNFSKEVNNAAKILAKAKL